MACVNNLKELGVIVRVWENDGNDKPGAFLTAADEIWKQALAGTNAGPDCWAYYARSGNANTAILTCPADERQPAVNSDALTNNSHLSYFVGVGASDQYPNSILGGDRNLGPGTVPGSKYGFSPNDGKGNDVRFTGPVCWSLKMHSAGSRAGAGNILLGDGSCQQITSSSFWLKSPPLKGQGTNSAAVRLVFP